MPVKYRRRVFEFICLTLFLFLAANISCLVSFHVAASTFSSGWGQYHGDSSHNGYSSSMGPLNPIEVWNSSVGYTNAGLIAGSGILIFSSPVNSYSLYPYFAMSETNGSRLHDIQSLPSSSSYAAIGGDSVFNFDNQRLSACSAQTGGYEWGYNVPLGSSTSILYGSAGVTYYMGQVFGVSFGSNYVTALSSSTGALIWQEKLAGAVDTIPTIGSGVLGVGFSNWQQVSALSANTGASLWNFTVDGVVDASLAYDVNNFFFGTMNGTFYCVSQNGQQTWTNNIGNAIETSPATADGLVFFGSDNGTLCALDESNGHIVWTQSTGGEPLTSSPVVASNGILYQASTSGQLFAFNAATGNQLWNTTLGAGVIASPVLDDGSLFLVDSNGVVYAFADSNSGSSPSPTTSLSTSSSRPSVSPTATNSLSSSGPSPTKTITSQGGPSSSPPGTIDTSFVTLIATIVAIAVAIPVTAIGIVEHRKRERCEQNKTKLLKKITEAKSDHELVDLKDEIAEELKQGKITNDGHDALDRIIEDKREKFKSEGR